MKREEIERLIVQVSTYEKGTIPFMCACDQLLSEFDRLKLRVASLAADLWDANAALDKAQSWLDKISGPIKEWLKSIPPDSKSWDEHKTSYAFKSMATIQAYLDSQSKQPSSGHRCSDGKIHTAQQEDCPICNPKDHTAECAKILKMPPAEVEWLKKIEIEEADPKCEHKNLGLLALGGTQRCLDCHEWIIAKPFTQCPECHGTKYINRVVSCADWELHPIYVIATCLNCKGEGVI